MTNHLTPALNRFWLDLLNLQIMTDWQRGLISEATARAALARVAVRIDQDHV